MRIVVTGAAGNAGRAIARLLADQRKYELMLCDVAAMPQTLKGIGTYRRCDTRTPADVDAVVAGADCVVHLAAWHCAHEPPVSDETIFAVNVDGTFNVIQSARKHRVKALVFASSMAYSHRGVYGVSKVLGEDLCRMFHATTQSPTVCLRYHAFVPRPYLEFGNRLLFNGVDRQDVARATLAAIEAALAGRVSYFMTIVHHRLNPPGDIQADFASRGAQWLESRLPGAAALIEKYAMRLPERLEHHDLSEAERLLGWRPQIDFLTFLADLQRRQAQGQDVRKLWTTGELASVTSMPEG